MAAHSRLWCSLTATYSGSWANCGKEQKILSLNACQIKTNKHFCTIYSFWKTTFRLQWWEDIQQLHFDYLSVFKYMLLLGQRRLLLILILNSSSTATKVGGYLSKCYWCCCFFFPSQSVHATTSLVWMGESVQQTETTRIPASVLQDILEAIVK